MKKLTLISLSFLIFASGCSSTTVIPGSSLKTKNKTIIFTCLSGLTTSNRAAQIQECASSCENIYLLDGGTNAWEQAGLPIEKATTGCSLDIMRQVQIAAGSLILLGALLGWLVSPYFFLICAFVGAGLLFAGITGFCGMVHLLNKMPWNKIS